jgi:hypothetical protein
VKRNLRRDAAEHTPEACAARFLNVAGSWRMPWRSGEAVWCAFDHGSIAGRQFGAMGMVDYFRLPKRQWYWYRNEYLKIPPPEWPKAGLAPDKHDTGPELLIVASAVMFLMSLNV